MKRKNGVNEEREEEDNLDLLVYVGVGMIFVGSAITVVGKFRQKCFRHKNIS